MRALVATDPSWSREPTPTCSPASLTALSVTDHGNRAAAALLGLDRFCHLREAGAGRLRPHRDHRQRQAGRHRQGADRPRRQRPGQDASTSSSARIAPVTPTSGRSTTTISGARRFAAMWWDEPGRHASGSRLRMDASRRPAMRAEAAVAAQERVKIVSSEGLSAAVGDLHRPGAARAGAGRASTSSSSRCAGRPTRSGIRCMTRSRRRSSTCRNICTRSRWRVLRALVAGLPRAGFWRALARSCRTWRATSRATASAASARRWCWPRNGRQGGEWLHAHFIHTPASATRYASLLTGIPWTCSAHAKDIWTSRDWELADKLASARWTVTCTASGFDRLTTPRRRARQRASQLSRPRPRPLRTVRRRAARTATAPTPTLRC